MSEDKNSPQETKQTLSRRELLKTAAALSGAVAAASLLPGKWLKPKVAMGVLPAHAQATRPVNTPTATTHVPPHIIEGCSAVDPQNPGQVFPFSTLQLDAIIDPPDPGVPVNLVVYLNEGGGSVILNVTKNTDASGRFPTEFLDLGPFVITPGVDRITCTWTFVNADDGTGSCVRNIEVVFPPD